MSVSTVSGTVKAAIDAFDKALPGLGRMRNVGEHIENYAVDDSARHDKSVCGSQLQVGSWDGTVYSWLGESLDIDVALDSAQNLFQAIRQCQPGSVQ